MHIDVIQQLHFSKTCIEEITPKFKMKIKTRVKVSHKQCDLSMWFTEVLYIGVHLQDYEIIYHYIGILKKMHLHMHLFEKYEGKGQRKLIVG